MNLQEAHDLVNECWQNAEDVWDWLVEEGHDPAEYRVVIYQLDEAINYLDKAANSLEKLKRVRDDKEV